MSIFSKDKENDLKELLCGIILLLVVFLIISFQFHGETIIVDRGQIEKSLNLTSEDAAAPKLGLFQLGAHVEDFDVLEDIFEELYRDGDGDDVGFDWSKKSHNHYTDTVIKFDVDFHKSPDFPDVSVNFAAYFDVTDNALIAATYLIRPKTQSQCEIIRDAMIKSVRDTYGAGEFQTAFGASFDSQRSGYERYSVEISDGIAVEVNDDCDDKNVPDFVISLFEISEKNSRKMPENIKERAAAYIGN